LIYHTIWSVPITFAMPYKEGFDATNYGVFCFYLFCLYNCCLSIIRAKEPSFFFIMPLDVQTKSRGSSYFCACLHSCIAGVFASGRFQMFHKYLVYSSKANEIASEIMTHMSGFSFLLLPFSVILMLI
jgi:hypothetical protein